jgi:hypothetical protein
MEPRQYDSDAPMRRDDTFTDGGTAVGTQPPGYSQYQGHGGAPGGAYAYGPQQRWAGPRMGYGFSQRRWRNPIETKPFFLTSEFAGTLLAIIALASTAAAMPNLGARTTWILIAAMVFSYALSRGLAKAGTQSYSVDPRESLLGQQGGALAQQAPRPRPGYGIETKPSFMTSEFLGTVLAILALAISTAVIDSLNVRLGWILITAMVCGYVLSRGVAKVGVKSHAFDPREEVFQPAAGDGQARHEQGVTGR